MFGVFGARFCEEKFGEEKMMKKIKVFLDKFKFRLLIIAGSGILLDILIFKFGLNLAVLFLIGFWISAVWYYKLEGKISVLGGLFFIVLCTLFLIFKKETMAEEAILWAYIFLAVGVGKMFFETS